MAVVVSLKDVVEAMDLPNNEWNSYLNPKTGEIIAVTDEDRHLVEDTDLDEDELPEWQRESLPKVRQALESGDLLCDRASQSAALARSIGDESARWTTVD